MKLSTQLLIALVGVILCLMVSVNILLKKQYDENGGGEPLALKELTKKPFKHLIINGYTDLDIVVKQGDSSSVQIARNPDYVVNTKMIGDTLIVDFPNGNWYKPQPYSKNFHTNRENFVILTPQLVSVQSARTAFDLMGFKQENLKVNLTENAKLIFKDSQIKQLNISLKGNSAVDFFGKSSVQILNALVKDSSVLVLTHLQVQKTNIQADDEALITLSGKNMKKILE